jgi:hypothetical protein
LHALPSNDRNWAVEVPLTVLRNRRENAARQRSGYAREMQP